MSSSLSAGALPPELESALGSEPRDFVVYSRHEKTLKELAGTLVFSILWLGFVSFFVMIFLWPLFTTGEVHFSSNKTPVVATWENWGPLVVPGMAIGIFLVVGIGMFVYAIVSLFAKGGWMVGTPKALVIYRQGKFRAIDWEQFSGDLEVTGNDSKGTLIMVMRTGRMVSQKHGNRYVPDKVNIVGVPGIFAIERMCRQRIKENDPTPAAMM